MRRASASSSRTGHYDNRHSRWVARLKVLLPLVAVLILSTLFLLADRRGSGDAIPYSDVELDRIVDEGRIANPSYAGVAGDGAAISLSADEAWPEDADRSTMRAARVIGAWESRDGARVTVTADTGRVTEGDGTVRLEGSVSVSDAQGYRVRSEALDLDLETADITSPGGVTGTGPPGQLTAGAMRIAQEGEAPLMRFSDGVKLVYDPASSDGD